MPIDEQKLRDILAEQEANIKRHVSGEQENIKRHVSEQQENIKRHVSEQEASIKRHVGVLAEEADRKFDIVSEGYQGLADKIDLELAAIRKELEEIRLHLFRKADLDRLEAVEKRVNALEKRALGRQ